MTLYGTKGATVPRRLQSSSVEMQPSGVHGVGPSSTLGSHGWGVRATPEAVLGQGLGLGQGLELGVRMELGIRN